MGTIGVNVLPGGGVSPVGSEPGQTDPPPRIRRLADRLRRGRPGSRTSPPQVWNERFPGAILLSLGVTWLTLVSALLFWSLAPTLVGWHPRVVLTGSMTPALRPGDVVMIASAPPSIPPGRVALVPDPARAGQTYLHRVVRVDEQGVMTTQGDANPTPDSTPVTPGGALGELRLVIPAVGRPVVWAREHRTAPLLGVGVLTLGSLALILFQDVRFRSPGGTSARPRRFRT